MCVTFCLSIISQLSFRKERKKKTSPYLHFPLFFPWNEKYNNYLSRDVSRQSWLSLKAAYTVMPLCLFLSSFFSPNALTHLQCPFEKSILISQYIVIGGIFCDLTTWPSQNVALTLRGPMVLYLSLSYNLSSSFKTVTSVTKNGASLNLLPLPGCSINIS